MRFRSLFQVLGWLLLIGLVLSIEQAISLPFISSWLVLRGARDQKSIRQTVTLVTWGVVFSLVTPWWGGLVAASALMGLFFLEKVELGWFERWKTGFLVAISLIGPWWQLGMPTSLVLVGHVLLAVALAVLVARRSSLVTLRRQLPQLGTP